jgi:thymidine kinase
MSLTVILAPMFSGKTTYLLSQASISLDLGFRPVFVTHLFENRNSSVFTHSSIFTPNLEDKISIIKTEHIDETLLNKLYTYSHVYVDEFQFFNDKEDLQMILKLSEKKHVCVAGLKGDSNNNKFGFILDLIPHADELVFLKSNCTFCAKKGKKVGAPFTKRLSHNTDTVLVGGNDKYVPVCRKHYFQD